MTCRRQRRFCVCKDAVRNDMQKEGRVRGGKNVARNDMQKIAALLRVQEGAAGANPQPPTNLP